MPRLAIAFAIVGALLAWSALRRGPALETPSRALGWSKDPIDAGAVETQFTVSGVEFLRAHDATEPVLAFAVLRRGEQHLALDDFNAFHLVEVHDGRLWALGENETEGPGPTLELLVSEDQGQTFSLRASVPKPHYLASFERWELHGDDLRLELSIDDEVPIPNEWLWPWWQLSLGDLHPHLGPGRFALHSTNGGRSWRLER